MAKRKKKSVGDIDVVEAEVIYDPYFWDEEGRATVQVNFTDGTAVTVGLQDGKQEGAAMLVVPEGQPEQQAPEELVEAALDEAQHAWKRWLDTEGDNYREHFSEEAG